MQWRGRRESSNVVDRRGAAVGVLGGGGLIVAIVYALLSGDPSAIFNSLSKGRSTTPTAQDSEYSKFAGVVLADTEDVWNKAFAAEGRTYTEPKLVLFTAQVRSACGLANSAVGPFYCPADGQVYLDLGFFQQMADRLHAPGDFAQAYVIAHEVGHHVQNLLGLASKDQSSVKIELQADCLAGYWAKSTQSIHQSLEPGDIQEALNAASAVGDDALQKASQGYVVPDSFTHGSSKQRVAAFSKGFAAESWHGCDTALAG